MRSDVLNRIVPGTLSPEEAAVEAPGLGDAPHHYRVVDVKYSTIDLSPDGHLVGKPEYATQLWIYNEALGRVQGYTPPSAYLLARVTRPEGGERSASSLERLGRVDRDLVLEGDLPLAELVGPGGRVICVDLQERMIRSLRKRAARAGLADRIETPLLIQFGDEDEAVPWTQGIELYLACRRLDKDCIMLTYRGEPHHLKQVANRLDYSIKMKEFFDHHLKGEPAPKWWVEGVPYGGN